MGKLVKPKNKLKTKVGDGGFNDQDLKKAQIVIEKNKIDFEPIARDLFTEIEAILTSIKTKEKKANDCLGILLDALMKLRAQGSLFHYPSITHISDVIVDFLDTEKTINEDVIDILAVYRKTGDAIISLKIKDVKNKTCLTLINELRQACTRYQKKHRK